MNVITSNANSIDRISNLPDPLLCHILSFLTTKEAAATSVLSKQWRFLWILVPDIHVIDSQIRRNGLYGFKHVIYNILLRKPPSNIRKIRLQSNTKSNHQFLSIFLSRAPACNVEELDLHVWNWVDHNSNKRVFFKLPRGVFSYEKLLILKLTREICIDVVSNSVQLPSLKVLHLLCVRYKGDESVRSLISGCLVLNDLHVKRAKLDGVISSYDISSRTLTNVCVDCRDLDFGLIKLHKIDAPALKYLTLIDPLLSSFQFSNFDNLVEANIHVGYRIKACERDAMADMFRALCNVKSMQLKSIFKALLNTHDYQHTASFKKLPTFHNLVTLKLSDIYCVGCIFKGLLPKFPRLEHLTILKVQRCYCCGVLPYPTPSTFVPACLSSHLTTFKLQKFEGLQLEMDFIKCLLKNSKNLMNITIFFSPCLSSLNKFRFQKKISRFEKRSSGCQLSFEEGKNM